MAQLFQVLGSQMWVEGLATALPGVGFLAKVAMSVSTDVAARTCEVTGVEPASGPGGCAGWTLQDRTEMAAGGPGAGKAKPRRRSPPENET